MVVQSGDGCSIAHVRDWFFVRYYISTIGAGPEPLKPLSLHAAHSPRRPSPTSLPPSSPCCFMRNEQEAIEKALSRCPGRLRPLLA